MAAYHDCGTGFCSGFIHNPVTVSRFETHDGKPWRLAGGGFSRLALWQVLR